MTIGYHPTTDLVASADLTYQNMRSYYQHYGVDWQAADIQAQISSLTNLDIVVDEKVVGAIRLAFDEDACWIRDLQVMSQYQNDGIGAAALIYCEELARQANVKRLSLRVFKVSPAYHLYARSGFSVCAEEERFYYMSRDL